MAGIFSFALRTTSSFYSLLRNLLQGIRFRVRRTGNGQNGAGRRGVRGSDQAFVRNHYIGRTFLQPSQLIRDFNVRVKLNLIGEMVRGKRVVVVDDSIVRGTTAMARVKNLREAGATEVHLRVSCPPHRHACHYGIDFPDPKKLIANQHSTEAIAGYLGADSIGYLSVPGMIKATSLPANGFCLACFNGDYPVPVPEGAGKFVMGKQRTGLVPEVSPQTELFGKLK